MGMKNISRNQKRSVKFRRAVFVTLIIQPREARPPPPPDLGFQAERRAVDGGPPPPPHAQCFMLIVPFPLGVRILPGELGGLTHSFLSHR